ncbi:EAL domain-containing protein [Paenibacillus frigoriresistens]|nr:EAL domain-containing protein [Paenibacillus frigoriresistens]NRF94625.1 EAL domain-containing protein [Paenibacillus frigoriresistens]
MHCTGCQINELNYEVRFDSTFSQLVISKVIDYLERRKIRVQVQGNVLSMKEPAAKELYDFCIHHLDTLGITFQVNHQEWQPIAAMDSIFEMQWVDEIIKKERVTCHYQPIVNAKEEVFAFEILARFTREDGSLTFPNEMFAAARNRGRLYALDRLCRMTAVRYAASLKNRKAFINFIPTSIYSPEYCLQSTSQLAIQMGVDSSLLVFEVVETDKVQDIEHLKKILIYYREQGFEYALDDVGEGHSTMELLDGITPHYMKLDIQYVQGVAYDTKKQRIALEFLHKAQEIGSIPLAEGVETRVDFEWLKHNGYQLFQGYLFGRPSPNI